MRLGILLALILLGLAYGCRGQAVPGESLQDKQFRFVKFYEGQKVLVEGLDAFHEKFGKWPKDFEELYEARLLPEHYFYPSRSGSVQQGIDRDFATITVLDSSVDKLRYRLRILGHEFEESTLDARLK